MRLYYLIIFIIFTFNACVSNNQNIILNKKSNIDKRTHELIKTIKNLSTKINKEEATKVSYEAISYSKELANNYEIVKPPLFHNTLINLKLKEKGYCYHFANDLMKYLKEKKYKSFSFKKVVANRNDYFEHTSVLLTREDIKFEDSLILDAWRGSGELFWSKVKDDKKYKWEIK